MLNAKLKLWCLILLNTKHIIIIKSYNESYLSLFYIWAEEKQQNKINK